jgi:hypothetical protein
MTPLVKRALFMARAYCRSVTLILALGGSLELAEQLLGDCEDALRLWAEEGGKGCD